MPLSVALLRTEITRHYPDLAILRKSVKARDWAAVSAYFSQLPPRSDQSIAVRAVAQTRRSERFLRGVVDAEPDSSLARTLLGARFIVIGWKARTAQFARYVSQRQWRVFHDYLGRAERLLADATAIDPASAAAWTERVTLARGLSLGLEEGQRRYERAAEHCDAPYGAQWQFVQNLCPKWGGSLEAVHSFARRSLAGAKPGSLGGAVVAEAHVEHAFTFNTMYQVNEYLGQPRVRDEVAAAAAQTVLHPDFQPGHGRVGAHSTFAFALFRGGDYPRAAPHFAALGRHTHPHPWDVWDHRWKVTFCRAGRVVRKW